MLRELSLYFTALVLCNAFVVLTELFGFVLLPSIQIGLLLTSSLVLFFQSSHSFFAIMCSVILYAAFVSAFLLRASVNEFIYLSSWILYILVAIQLSSNPKFYHSFSERIFVVVSLISAVCVVSVLVRDYGVLTEMLLYKTQYFGGFSNEFSYIASFSIFLRFFAVEKKYSAVNLTLILFTITFIFLAKSKAALFFVLLFFVLTISRALKVKLPILSVLALVAAGFVFREEFITYGKSIDQFIDANELIIRAFTNRWIASSFFEHPLSFLSANPTGVGFVKAFETSTEINGQIFNIHSTLLLFYESFGILAIFGSVLAVFFFKRSGFSLVAILYLMTLLILTNFLTPFYGIILYYCTVREKNVRT